MILLLFGVNESYSQVKGIVYGKTSNSKKAIFGARIHIINANLNVLTDEDGKFEIRLPKNLPDTMVFSARGYNPDTIVVTKNDRFISYSVTLYSDVLLPEVIASYKKGTHSISRLNTLHVENIDAGELRKAACCNLSESFETNASVDVNVTDAVSGAKKIQMMGLDGVYTQIQLENIPYLRGLETSFGLNSMSGTWIQSMQITKGTGNVVNGYESMAGLVNLEVKKPQNMEKVYLNVYGNAMGRMELNFNTGFNLNDKWSSGWLGHASTQLMENDRNNDGFRDQMIGTNVALMNRYHYQGNKMEAQFGYNAYWDRRNGGQMSNIRKTNPSSFFDVNLDSKHVDFYAKTGFFLKKPSTSIGVVYNLKYQSLQTNFGNRFFDGEEKRGYINAIYDGYFGNTDHKIKVGVSGVYSDITQSVDSLSDDRLEIVPGAFGEYTYTGSRLSSVLGVRGDYHNLYGFQFSPRLHLKYILTEITDLRFTVGKGWRVPNYMIDNVSLMSSSKQWIAPSETKPEISWNIGGSVMQEFKMFKQNGSLTVDFYHTRFENQLIVDREENINAIKFTNLEGKSYSNSLQVELAINPLKTLELRFAYKYLDVKAEYNGVMQQQVLVPEHRGLFNIGYKTRNKRWEYDLTTSIFGESRLPQVNLPSGELTTKNRSLAYPLINAQITHVYRKFDFYVGGENILNYKQPDAIIDAENPFSSTFNATRIWGPIVGANVYAGVRFTIERDNEE